MQGAESSSFEISNVRIDAVGMQGAIERVIALASSDGTNLAVGINANVCNLARNDRDFRERLAGSALNYPDGQSVVWALRLFGINAPERVATTDLALPLLLRAADENLPVFFFGARPGIASLAAEQILSQAPTLKLATHHGYVREVDQAQVVSAIRAHGTAILFVGLGDPRQQEWVERYAAETGAGVVLTSGGLFDWLSGSNKRAPQWMISAGLEWLWRLMIEPRRLAKRYLLGNPAFVAAIAWQWVADKSIRKT